MLSCDVLCCAVLCDLPACPSCLRSHVVFPGEEIDSCETWKPADGSGQTYLKLADSRGWVGLVDGDSGEAVFDELVT